jgi:hypothetical protein
VSFKDFVAAQGPKCRICRLDPSLVADVNENENSSKPERTLMLDYLEQETKIRFPKEQLYSHRQKCLGLAGRGARA